MNAATKVALDISSASDLRSALPAARRAGFEGITTSARRLALGELSHTGRREIRSLLARHELAGAALRADAAGKGLTADVDAERFLAELEQAATGARDCGFLLVACDLGRLPPAQEQPPPPRPVDPAMAGLILLPGPADVAAVSAQPARPLTEQDRRDAAFAADVLREAGRRLDRIGMAVAFSASLSRTSDLAALLGSVACPLFGRELDPVASLEEGPANVVAIEPALLHVRGRDAHAGAGGRQRPAVLGEGDVDWPQLLAALRDADFRGFVSIDGEGSPGESLRRLGELS